VKQDTSKKNKTIFIGRQPIFNKKLQVEAYELLYRDSANNYADFSDGEIATNAVIVNAFLDIGVENLVGDTQAFINIPRGLLLNKAIYGLPKELVVLEILEDVVLDEPVIESLKSLKQSGYKIALDDFVYDESKAPIVALADIVKIDLMALSSAQIKQQLDDMAHCDVKFLAEKLETKQEFLECQQLGFSYYQGYYFCKPEVVSGSKTPTNRLALLQIFAKIFETDVSMQEMEQLISQDVSLSYKLLKAINSAAFANTKRVGSIKQAITRLGLKRIQNWVSFIVYSEADNKPLELFRMSMLRAKMCEILAESLHVVGNDKAFTVGLFSCLDMIMDQSIDGLVAPLPLSDDVKKALLTHEGELGRILDCVIYYESGDWELIPENITAKVDLPQTYLQSLKWASEIYDSLR